MQVAARILKMVAITSQCLLRALCGEHCNCTDIHEGQIKVSDFIRVTFRKSIIGDCKGVKARKTQVCSTFAMKILRSNYYKLFLKKWVNGTYVAWNFKINLKMKIVVFIIQGHELLSFGSIELSHFFIFYTDDLENTTMKHRHLVTVPCRAQDDLE